MVQICISLVANDTELVKHLFNVGPFYNWVNYHCVWFFFIFWIQVFSGNLKHILLVNSLTVFFAEQKFLVLMIIKVLFYAHLKSHCQTLRSSISESFICL